MQLLIALSLAESCATTNKSDCYALLKQKLVEYVYASKADTLEEYALSRLNYLFSVQPEFAEVQKPFNQKLAGNSQTSSS